CARAASSAVYWYLDIW
nr:immunoglobulin heavy chain junction region [Macaca mulatta]MOW32283.1 immunoglobulin heavy chain junction region [Macaca mulatta]MOW32889.1 immunoglobulin heavy chain junction region [Macaca mulatta]MOW32969.1 immunoglobulin heavy chain junction region [Macaca mulatta]MOW33439.1 immunoglobulin heavy chain junction region [Macaca mulatta]